MSDGDRNVTGKINQPTSAGAMVPHEKGPAIDSGSDRDVLGTIKVLVVAGLVIWGGVAWWQLRRARQVGEALKKEINTTWLEACPPLPGTREKLLAAAEALGGGSYGEAADALGPIQAPSNREKTAAQRFLDSLPDLRQRFIAVAAAGLAQEADGSNTDAAQQALTRAMAAAARQDEAATAEQLRLAEVALDQPGTSERAAAIGSCPEAVTQLLRQIESPFKLGRELMTEGHAAAEKLVRRASWAYAAKDVQQASMLIRLAADLLNVQIPSRAAALTPKWFDDLATAPPTQADPEQAKATIQLAGVMAQSDETSNVVKALVRRARRELAVENFAEAQWWAEAALNALAMSDQAIADATAPQPADDANAPETESTE